MLSWKIQRFVLALGALATPALTPALDPLKNLLLSGDVRWFNELNKDRTYVFGIYNAQDRAPEPLLFRFVFAPHAVRDISYTSVIGGPDCLSSTR